jgi:hypothetical protein
LDAKQEDEGSEGEDVDDFSSDPVNNPHLSLSPLPSPLLLAKSNFV